MHNITARYIILFCAREIRKPVQHVPCTLYMLCEALTKKTIKEKKRDGKIRNNFKNEIKAKQ